MLFPEVHGNLVWATDRNHRARTKAMFAITILGMETKDGVGLDGIEGDQGSVKTFRRFEAHNSDVPVKVLILPLLLVKSGYESTAITGYLGLLVSDDNTTKILFLVITLSMLSSSCRDTYFTELGILIWQLFWNLS